MTKLIEEKIRKLFTLKPHQIYTSNVLKLELSNKIHNLEETDNNIIINNGELNINKGDLIPYTINIQNGGNNLEQTLFFTANILDYYEDDNSIFIAEEEVTEVENLLFPLYLDKLDWTNHRRYLINCYLSKNKQVVCKYKHNIFDRYNILDKSLKRQSTFDRVEISEDKRYNYYYFSLPLTIKEDYNRFLNGKYHKYSRRSKEKIIKLLNLKVNHYTYQVLYNGKKMVEQLESLLGTKIPEGMNFKSKPDIKKITYES